MLFVKKFKKTTGLVSPVIKRMFPTITAKDFVNVQPMNQPSGLVFYMDYKYSIHVFYMWEELWLEDDDFGGLWCPQIDDAAYITDEDFKEMRFRELIFEDWEIKQQERYTSGLGNDEMNVGELDKMIKKEWGRMFENSDHPPRGYMIKKNDIGEILFTPTRTPDKIKLDIEITNEGAKININ